MIGLWPKKSKLVKKNDNSQYPEVVAGAFIQNKKGKVVLFKSTRWNNIWIPSGSHIDYGETLEETIVREIKEETGVEVDNIRFIRFGEVINDPDFYRKAHLIFFHFLCQLKDGQNLKLDSHELVDFKWFTLDEVLESQEVDDRTRDTIKRIKDLKSS